MQYLKKTYTPAFCSTFSPSVFSRKKSLLLAMLSGLICFPLNADTLKSIDDKTYSTQNHLAGHHVEQGHLASARLKQNTQMSTLNGDAYFEISSRWTQGALVTGRVLPGSVLTFEGKLVSISSEGVFAFGLGRDAPSQVVLTQKTPKGHTHEHRFEVSSRTYATQSIQGVKKKHVTPPASVTERIKREGRAVRQARTLNDDRTDFLSTFIWPAKGPVTGVYGSQRIYNGVPKRPHYGIDIAGPTGAPVIAPASGVVTFANNDLYYSGGTLILDHGLGISSTFIHLSKVEVAVGDLVEQGQLIARIGASGRATGPHLDWRMNWFGERLDPQLLFPEGDKPPLK